MSIGNTLANLNEADLPSRRTCAAMDEHRRLLNEDPGYALRRAAIETLTWEYQTGARQLARTGISRIPVVVHVVWNTPDQNISDAQIQSQMDVLNQDFRRTNPDVADAPDVFENIAGDSRIEFFLATSDPNGAPSTGITRTQTQVAAFGHAGNPVKSAATGGADPWPTDRYLNIWVCRLSGGLLGYAQFPGGPAETDGVVARDTAFGTIGTATPPFHRGRTATHEIGHWLNLFHIWGDDGSGCNGSDECPDTPNAAGPNFGCPGFPRVTCNNGPDGDMFMNYMDYVDDPCMVMFTAGQVTRMQATLDGPRSGLGLSPGQFVLANFGYDAGGWRVEKHPRFVADLTGDGRGDVLGFGDAGVWVALNNGDASFQPAVKVIDNFAYDAGGWRVEKHPRMLADLTGDGRADVVGFGDAGVWISLNDGNGAFQEPAFVIANFGYQGGGWRVEKHPRFLADLTGDGRADVIGFGDAGVWVALGNGDGSFQEPQFVLANFGYNAGGWRVERHPRYLADVTGDGTADIVGFGDGGVWIALNNGDGTFQEPVLAVANFGYGAGGWRVERHPRFLSDLTGDGRADIVGFGDAGVWVSYNNGDGSFQPAAFVLDNFGYHAGGWRVEKHPRMLADVSGDGRADIVGFGDAGVWVACNTGTGAFQPAEKALANFAYDAGGWRVEKHPRFVANLTPNPRADVIGFGDAGVWVALDFTV
jgi:hypothetical protein